MTAVGAHCGSNDTAWVEGQCFYPVPWTVLHGSESHLCFLGVGLMVWLGFVVEQLRVRVVFAPTCIPRCSVW